MKALILVGGFGTRLRPLTLTLPKPLIEFANKPMISHQIESLCKAGVTDIVLAVNYRPEAMVGWAKEHEKKYGIKITFSVETEPLGTAGPLALAKDILNQDPSPFFVLNSDVICDFPFVQLASFHQKHGCEGTIVVTKVEEPSKYGVVVRHPNSNLIEKFVEKPTIFISNRINAGMYIFNPSILARIPLKPTSIEKVVFPRMAEDQQLHAMDLDGFWMDVGQPKDFLYGISLYLDSLRRKHSKQLRQGADMIGNVLVHPTSKIGQDCQIGPNVTIDEGAVIGDGVRIKNSVVLRNCTVRDHAWIDKSIVGWNCRVGRWTRMEGVSVLGDDVTIGDEMYVNGGCILPHKSISSSIPDPQIIM